MVKTVKEDALGSPEPGGLRLIDESLFLTAFTIGFSRLEVHFDSILAPQLITGLLS